VAGKLKGDLIQVFEDVPIGIKVEKLIEKAGGCCKEYGEIIMGGPFTGKRTSMASPIVKTTGGIIIAETFLKGPDKIGILVCACGANEERLKQIAADMGSYVVDIEYCKHARKMNRGYKCENPGICPGQVQRVLAIKKAGAKAILISNCSDCTNTVMSCAPKLKLPVYHCTDGALRAVNHKLIRKLKTL
jgi:electron transport complex protein RnfC